MADDKKGFILYADLITVVEKLILKDRENKTNYSGELFYHILKYVNDKEPIAIDFIVEMAFEPIKLQLKRDLKKYEDKKGQKSISGREGNLKRWNLDLYNDYKKGIYTLKIAENIAEGRKVSHSDKVPSQSVANIAVIDSVTVTGNDTVTDINKTLMSKIKISDLEEEEKYYFEISEAFRKLFIKNLKETGAPTNHQENAKFKNYVDPIRLMIKTDKITQEQITSVFKYLDSPKGSFWKPNILSTKKLREKFQQLVVKSNTNETNTEKQPTINRQTAEVIASNSTGWKRNRS